MFNKLNKILYNFEGKELALFNFSNGYSIKNFKNTIFSKKINYDLLLDKISIENYSDFKYYYIPFYCGEILNPFFSTRSAAFSSALRIAASCLFSGRSNASMILAY